MNKITAPEIAEELADRIRIGRYRPGEQLHYATLAGEFGVQSWTIKRAVGLLRAMRLAEDVPGRGVFVAERLP